MRRDGPVRFFGDPTAGPVYEINIPLGSTPKDQRERDAIVRAEYPLVLDRPLRPIHTAVDVVTTILEAYGLEVEGEQTMKSGYKTTEFWFILATNLFGATLASGLVAEGSTIAEILGVAMIILGNLGYTYARTKAKIEESRRSGRASHAVPGGG